MRNFKWALITLYAASAVLAYGHSYTNQKSTVIYSGDVVRLRAGGDRFMVAIIDAALAPLYWSTVYWRKNA
jgi:hypothetical protein